MFFLWSFSDAGAKQEYQSKADEDKARHEEEMKEYVPPSEGEDDDEASSGKKTKRGKKQAKDPNAPKKPMTAYFFFMAQERAVIKAENPTATIGELGKLMGLKWKGLSEEEKAPFNDAAAKAKDDYMTAFAKYSAGGVGDDNAGDGGNSDNDESGAAVKDEDAGSDGGAVEDGGMSDE